MRYGSVCSGVEAASLAWMPLDWECKFVSEIEPFPCAVLQQRFGASAPINVLDPNENGISKADRKIRINWIKQYNQLNKEGVIPNEGDFTKIGKKYAGQIDLLVGGTPCQDLSVAGKRAGFDGERSSLAIDFVRLAYESQCKWVIWENVPGVFSSNKGRDFARLLSLFTGCDVEVPKDGFKSAGFVCNARRDRYGVAWRVLDAQFTRVPGFPFAIPQRRRRVFVVGYFGDWVRAAEVLLEPSRLPRNTPPRRIKGKGFPADAQRSAGAASRDRCISLIPYGTRLGAHENGIASTIARIDAKFPQCVCTTGRPWDESGVNPTLNQCNGSNGTPGQSNQELFAQNFNGLEMNQTAVSIGNGQTAEASIMMEECCQTLNCMHDQQAVMCLNDQGGSVMQVEENGNAGTLRANTHGNEQIICIHGAENPICNQRGFANPVTASHNGLENSICYDTRGNGNGQVSPTATAIVSHATIRRLLPIECERLMGFPDNHTRIVWKGKVEEDCPDAPRYKACGNSMCVNVMRWIGMQIDRVNKMESSDE